MTVGGRRKTSKSRSRPERAGSRLRDKRDRRLPDARRWLFWEHDFAALRVERHANSILARVLEFGRMADVRWAIATYGRARIHRFFREVGHPEISRRTETFWRAVFRAKDETWARPPAWREHSSAPWVD